MTTPLLLRFVVRRITFTLTDTGYIITCYTNNPCHLFFRYTTIRPVKHINQRIVRGAQVGTYIDQCFVAFKDNEQEEAGDTYTHTFIKEPWVHCETRWFYMWGTVDGNLSPSASPIFSQHRIWGTHKKYFYPDSDPETTSVDGVASRFSIGTWAHVRDGPGNDSRHADGSLDAYIWAGNLPGGWVGIARTIILFDTSIIPADSEILAAKLRLYCFDKTLNGVPLVTLAIYASAPASNITLVNADYQALGAVPLSDPIPYADIIENSYNNIPLNSAGLNKIIPAGITKLGLRESTYDGSNAEPPWSYQAYGAWRFRSADFGGIYKPRLMVNYTPPA